MDDRLPRAMILELLADVLRDNPPPASQAKYEYRAYADRISDALARVSLDLAGRQKVVSLHRLRSSRQTRDLAMSAWRKRLDETGDEISAFEAALRVTLARERKWTLEDGVRHTLKFVIE